VFGSGTNVKTAAFNVLNYFNGDGNGGGFPTARGANSPAEFTRQRAKIIDALAAINADVVGVIELENDGTGPNSAIQDLVNGLNAVLGAGTYSFINDGAGIQPYNTDAIDALSFISRALLPRWDPYCFPIIQYSTGPRLHKILHSIAITNRLSLLSIILNQKVVRDQALMRIRVMGKLPSMLPVFSSPMHW
jgi:hypothetical protein